MAGVHEVMETTAELQ